jgi:hypothetical protein
MALSKVFWQRMSLDRLRPFGEAWSSKKASLAVPFGSAKARQQPVGFNFGIAG